MEKSNKDLIPNRKLFHFSISPAKDLFRKVSRSVPDSQSLREGQGVEDLSELRLGVESKVSNPTESPKPPLHPPVKAMQASVSKQYVTSPLTTLPHQSDHQLQKNQSEKSRVSKQDPNTPDKHKRCCDCKNSDCLMLRCICFKSLAYCHGCTGLFCHNKLDYEDIRQKAIIEISARYPFAFIPKRFVDKGEKHIKGCCCRKIGCSNNQCTCYQGNVLCSDNCKCQDCKNVEGKVERFGCLGPRVSGTNIQQTTNTPVKRPNDMSGDVNSPESKKRKDSSSG